MQRPVELPKTTFHPPALSELGLKSLIVLSFRLHTAQAYTLISKQAELRVRFLFQL